MKKLDIKEIPTFEKPEETSSGAVGKIAYILSMLVIIIAIFTAMVFIYWAVYQPSVLVIKNNPVPVEKAQVKSGEVQIVDINYCKYSDERGNVSWSLIGENQVILLDPYIDTNDRGCNTDLRAPLILPPIKYNGTYHFHWIVTYQANPVRTEVTTFDSKPFKVIGLNGGQ